MRRTVLLAVIGALALSACNTVRGAGEDLKSVANAGERAID